MVRFFLKSNEKIKIKNPFSKFPNFFVKIVAVWFLRQNIYIKILVAYQRRFLRDVTTARQTDVEKDGYDLVIMIQYIYVWQEK